MKIYGNLTNRFMENQNYKEDKELKVGDDITKYHWSDRTCYYITEVIDQKHIKVKRYCVCADHSKDIGMGHQEWLYFKTRYEEREYLKQFFDDIEYDGREYQEEEWVFRYGKWKMKHNLDPITLEKLDKPYYTDVGNISFGIRDHYYDWSF